jgi:hypothetical protein
VTRSRNLLVVQSADWQERTDGQALCTLLTASEDGSRCKHEILYCRTIALAQAWLLRRVRHALRD